MVDCIPLRVGKVVETLLVPRLTADPVAVLSELVQALLRRSRLFLFAGSARTSAVAGVKLSDNTEIHTMFEQLMWCPSAHLKSFNSCFLGSERASRSQRGCGVVKPSASEDDLIV